MRTAFFKCFPGEKEGKRIWKPQAERIACCQYNISGPCEVSQIQQSLVPETLRGLTTKRRLERYISSMLQYQCLFLEGYMCWLASIKIRNDFQNFSSCLQYYFLTWSCKVTLEQSRGKENQYSIGVKTPHNFLQKALGAHCSTPMDSTSPGLCGTVVHI